MFLTLLFTAVILSISEEQLPEDLRFWLVFFLFLFFPVTPLTLEWVSLWTPDRALQGETGFPGTGILYHTPMEVHFNVLVLVAGA